MISLIPGFSGTIINGTGSEPRADEVRRLRPSQRKVYKELEGLSHTILNSPTGWGKTTVLIFLALSRLLSNPKSKVLITVPQRIIGNGFSRKLNIELPDGKTAVWHPTDLCEKTPTKTLRLMKWLATSGEDLDNRVVVTTHAALVAAFARIEDRARVFHETIVIIDEGHHVQAGASEYEGYNRLGVVINTLIDLGVWVWLATAFFFRGDKLPILEECQLCKFKRIFIPFDEHLAELVHIKSYAYDFVAYRQSIFSDLEALLARSKVPTLMYCPPEGHVLLQSQSKSALVKRLTSLIVRHYPRSQIWTPDLPRAARDVIVDLVDLSERDGKVKYINTHGDQICAILTVGMMQEGADWPACARVIDLVPSTSDQVRNQKFGRLMRDYPGKEHIQYYSFLPYVLNKGEEGQRETFSKIFAHLHASLILENALKPIKMPVQRTSTQEGNGRDKVDSENEHAVDLLGQFDEPIQRRIEEEVSKELVHLASTLSGPLNWDEAGPAIETVLNRLGCAEFVGRENIVGLRDQIILLWRRRKQPNLAIEDLIGAGFDKVWATDALEPIKVFSAGICGSTTFQELRQILGSAGQQEAEAWARQCAGRYRPGSLPSQVSLDPTEREDAMKIAHVRMYKKGKKNGVFYPSVEVIFEAAGHQGVFDTTDFQTEAEEWAKECAGRYPPGQLPYQKSTDPQERHDGLKLANMKRAKHGEGTCIFYPTVERIFEEAGHRGVFAKADRQREAEEWASACAARYQPGRLPSEKSNDVQERKDGKKLSHMRASKRGTGQGAFYPSVEVIFEEAGHGGAFDVGSKPESSNQKESEKG
jgi:hypothetical protein